MKQKIIKYPKFILFGFLLVFSSCEKDPQLEEEEDGHRHGKNPNEVSMEFFKEITHIEDVGLFLKEKMDATASLNRMNSYRFSDFTIDTEIIYQCPLRNGDIAFSFRLYPKEDIAERDEMFNLVISRIEGEWRSSIYLLTINPDERIIEKYNNVEIVYSEIGIAAPLGTSRFANGYAINITFHCTNTGKCLREGRCDLCKLCVTGTVTYSFHFDEQEHDSPVFKINEGGIGGGSSASNHNNTTITDPCEELQKITSSYNYSHTIDHLKSKAPGNKEFGWIYKYAPNSKTFVAPTVAGQNTIDPNTVNLEAFRGLEWIGAFHNHRNRLHHVTMFSAADIEWLWSRADRNYRNNAASNKLTNFSEFFIGLVTVEKVYVLKIKNWAKFTALNDPQKRKDFREGLFKRYEKSASSSQESLEKDLLEELKNEDLGIGLYEHNEDGTWSEIVLNPVNNNNEVKRNPCN